MVFRDIEKNSYVEFLSNLNEDGVHVIGLALREQVSSPSLATCSAISFMSNSDLNATRREEAL